MIDYVIINPKLKKLQEYVGYLKEYQRHTVEELKKDYTLQGAVFHYLQLAIECVIDIGEILISTLKLRKPEEAREVIKILAENKILPDDFAQRFAPIAGFRNILVHEYAEIDLNKVHRHLRNDLKDFDFYARKITQFLQAQQP